MKKYLFIFSAMFAWNSMANIYTIGDGASCDYDTDFYTIQQAVDDILSSGNTVTSVRITNQKTYFENLEFSESVLLKGGYSDCNAANADNATGKTTINGSNSAPVLKVSDSTALTTVTLFDFTLTNGKGVGSSFGGGITVIDNNDKSIIVRLNNVTVSNSEGEYGGGIYVHGGDSQGTFDPLVVLTDSTIINNDGFSNGGGMYCYQGQAWIRGDTRFVFNRASNNNSAYGKGGGIYSSTGCLIRFRDDFEGQLYGNSATSHGGGIFVAPSSEVRTDTINPIAGVVFKGNFSDSDNNMIGDGGGVYLTGNNAILNLNGSVFEDNGAFYGGAISANDGASVRLGKFENQCWNQKSCNVLEGNYASKTGGYGGALYLNDATADLSHMVVSGNRAELGTVVYAESNAEVEIRTSMIYRNGNGGQNDWSDIFAYKTVNSSLLMTHVTSANNAVQGAVISQTNGGHILLNSIFYEPLQNLLADFVNATSYTGCLLMNDDNGMGTVPNSIIGSPSFIDGFNDNYHLSPSSDAIDMCGNTPLALAVDIDSEINGWDDPQVMNLNGVYDAGADESFHGDVIFKSSF